MANVTKTLKSSGSVMIHASNYNQWQYDIFKPFLSGRILEIGCGSGNLTELLVKNNNEIISVDIKKDATVFTSKRIKNKNLTVYNMDIFSQKNKKKLGKFDTIIFCNVLEHIKNDKNALDYCHKYLKNNNSKLILLVPAHQFIYGTLDFEVGHYKRYNISDIKKLAKLCKFNLNNIYYFNFIGAIGWFVNYKLLKRRNTNEGDNSAQINLFDKYIVKISRFIESIVKPPFGISVISIMEKKH